MPKTLPSNVFISDQQRARELLSPETWKTLKSEGEMKRGAWIKLLVEFQEHGEVKTELVTAMVAGITANGLIACRVLSSPTFATKHSLKYGDDLVVERKNVLALTQPGRTCEHCGAETPVGNWHGDKCPLCGKVSKVPYVPPNPDQLLAGPQPPLAPQPNKRYWTRNGTPAEVWTLLEGEGGQYWIGQAGDSRDVQWNRDGSQRQGNRDLDIVKEQGTQENTANFMIEIKDESGQWIDYAPLNAKSRTEADEAAASFVRAVKGKEFRVKP